MAGEYRNELRTGMRVAIVRKQDQRSGALTVGTIAKLLTSKPYHSRGIKVRLEDGQVGRVRQVDSGSEGGGGCHGADPLAIEAGFRLVTGRPLCPSQDLPDEEDGESDSPS